MRSIARTDFFQIPQYSAERAAVIDQLNHVGHATALRTAHGRPERPDLRQRERRAGAAQDGGPLWSGGGSGLYAPRAGQRRGIGAARDYPPEGWRVYAQAGQRRADSGGDSGECGRAQRGHRLHRHIRATAQQLQRTNRRMYGRRAVCVSHAGGWRAVSAR